MVDLEVLEDILLYLKNDDFLGEEHCGAIEITEGALVAPFLIEGQYYVIEGGFYNAGLHDSLTGLTDEHFMGKITPLKIPKRVLSIAEEAAEWKKSNGTGGYKSESFGGYSYTKDTTEMLEAFGKRLRPWRKI